MKLNHDDFHEVLKQTAGELIHEFIEEGKPELALQVTLIGALFGARLATNLFKERNSEIEIITDKE